MGTRTPFFTPSHAPTTVSGMLRKNPVKQQHQYVQLTETRRFSAQRARIARKVPKGTAPEEPEPMRKKFRR